jgi:hypothetical protein
MEPARHTVAASTAIDRIVLVIAKLLQKSIMARSLGATPIHSLEPYLLKHRLQQEVALPGDAHQEPFN